MKKLRELLDCDYDIEIKGIKINSKEVEKGDLFVCTTGVTVDRHLFIDEAIENGAAALIVKREGNYSVPAVLVDDPNKTLPLLCSAFYDYPERKLKIIGVTGTDGKTSTATMIQTLLGNDICGYIGTNGRSCAKFSKDIANTTPDSDKLYQYLAEFVDAGCSYVAIETSSEAFYRHRLDHIQFYRGIITNITSEHLNIHKTLENYIDCKAQLFRQLQPEGIAILNCDDDHYDSVMKASSSKITTYGKAENADFQIQKIQIHSKGTHFSFNYSGETYDVDSPLLAEFNVYNLSAAILCLFTMGISFTDMVSRFAQIKISGRLEMISFPSLPFYVMIDYAHTPNAISRLLEFVQTLNIHRSIVVLGSAGERDFLKRPLMGECVVKNADYVIFTYEDPRSEEVLDIIDMMIENIRDYPNYEIIPDRSSAIKRAIMMADDEDMVLILGKGNENYQKLKTGTIHFSDSEEAIKYLQQREETDKITT